MDMKKNPGLNANLSAFLADCSRELILFVQVSLHVNPIAFCLGLICV